MVVEEEEGVECTHVMHGRSRMVINPRIPIQYRGGGGGSTHVTQPSRMTTVSRIPAMPGRWRGRGTRLLLTLGHSTSVWQVRATNEVLCLF